MTYCTGLSERKTEWISLKHFNRSDQWVIGHSSVCQMSFASQSYCKQILLSKSLNQPHKPFLLRSSKAMTHHVLVETADLNLNKPKTIRTQQDCEPVVNVLNIHLLLIFQ